MPLKRALGWPRKFKMVYVLRPGLELKGGQWGFGHLRIGIFEKMVTLEVGVRIARFSGAKLPKTAPKAPFLTIFAICL